MVTGAPTHALMAAAVEVDITPPVGAPMAGYAARKGTSRGIHDPLRAGLLLVQTRESAVLLVSLDLIGVSLEFTRQVRRGIRREIGIPPESILLWGTHTHSGPAGLMPGFPGMAEEQNPLYVQSVAEKIVGAARWASGRLEPARFGVIAGTIEGLGSNRNDPGAEQDRQVTVLTVENLSGEPIAVWMNYGCHPTVLGADNLLFSADYPGAARETLNKVYPQTVFLFSNGASGDVSTRFTRREQGFNEVKRMGRLLAGEVLKLLQRVEPTDDHTLAGAAVRLELPFRQFPPPVEAEAELARQRQELDQLIAANTPVGTIRQAITRVEGAQAQLEWARQWRSVDNHDSELQALRIGPLGIVGVPGETFTRTALEIKSTGLAPFTAVISYANDYRGYFPDPEAIRQGNYEAFISPYDETAVNRIQQSALALLHKVFDEQS